MLFRKVKKDIRALNRARYILEVFTRYGFGYIIENIDFPFKLLKAPPRKNIKRLSLPVRVRKVFEELGPTFIKLGQMLSLRPDIIPFAFCQEFEKLQDQVPPIDFSIIKATLERELGTRVEDVFDQISPQSLASASLAQVHQAKFKGSSVVVKVQKNGVDKIIKSDIDVLEIIVDYIGKKYPQQAEKFNLRTIVDEFKRYIFKELDFKIEAVNIRRFKLNFQDESRIKFPAVFNKISTAKVLVTEEVQGVKINDLEKVKQAGWDRKKIADIGAYAVLKQIFIDGFFHGDPHPANIFVTSGEQICFLDCGIVGRLQEDTRIRLADIFTGVIEKDTQLIVDNLRLLGTLEQANTRELNFALQELLDLYHGQVLEEFNMAGFLRDLMRVISKNKVKLLPDVFLLMKSIIIIEGLGKELDPNFNVITHSRKFAVDLQKQRYSARRLLRYIKKGGRDFSYFAHRLPQDIIEIVNNLKQGQLKIAFEHRNLDKFIHTLDKISNRISLSLLISALVISSSVIIHTDKGPFVFGIPLLALAGLLIAAVLGLVLLISVLRSQK